MPTPQVLPFDEQFEIQKEKFNTMNWLEDPGFYMVGTDKSRFQVWQPGWTGGAMSGYALMKLGGEQEWEREIRTLSFCFLPSVKADFSTGSWTLRGKLTGTLFSSPVRTTGI